MIIRRSEPLPEDERPAAVRVSVHVNEIVGVVFLGAISLLIVVILGIVVVRLSGRRSD